MERVYTCWKRGRGRERGSGKEVEKGEERG